jgi:hypothetical protein
MLEIKLKKRLCLVPETWQECTPEQMRTFLLVKRVPIQKRVRVVMEGLIQAYLGLTDAEWQAVVFSFGQWETMKNFCAWIFEKPFQGKPFDFFDFEGIRYYLPAANYANSTALELSLGNMLFMEFAHPTEPDTTAIDRLIATFCRPEREDLAAFQISTDWNGDIREPYNQARMEATAKRFLDLDIATKVAFLNYFEGMNTDFLEEYSSLFGKTTTTPRYQDGTGWLMILKTVAKGNVWGGFDNVCRQPARTVWAFMLDDVLDERAQQAELDKQYEDANLNR